MRVSPKQYAQALYDLTDGKSKPEIEKAVADFSLYIYRNRKLKFTEKIVEQFAAIHNREKGIVEADVLTREKMGAELEKKIRDFLKEKYLAYRQAGQAKEVLLKNTIDESIRGGIILKVGDEIIDGSIAGRLGELRNILVK